MSTKTKAASAPKKGAAPKPAKSSAPKPKDAPAPKKGASKAKEAPKAATKKPKAKADAKPAARVPKAVPSPEPRDLALDVLQICSDPGRYETLSDIVAGSTMTPIPARVRRRLAPLRGAGLIEYRKDGKYHAYFATDLGRVALNAIRDFRSQLA